MSRSLDEFAREVLSGRDRSIRASLLRGILGAAEPAYAAMMAVRNRLYDRRWLRSHFLGRPAVSVGNLTAGGTGKTPVVQWLGQSLRQRGRQSGILLRGYMRNGSVQSDEATLLRCRLNEGAQRAVEIEANPDRLAGAAKILSRTPQTDLFILDDGFQHRRAQRAFDLVLIDATSPFGFGHVHPRGLLREPRGGLRRASAILLTRCDMVEPKELERLKNELRRWNAAAPIHACSHRHRGLVGPDASYLPIDELGRKRFFTFSGIAQPEALDRQLQKWGRCYAGHRWFEDHHTYTQADMQAIIADARAVEAQLLVTTEKDWVKLDEHKSLCATAGLPLHRLDLSIAFDEDDEAKLLAQIELTLFGGSAPEHPGTPGPLRPASQAPAQRPKAAL